MNPAAASFRATASNVLSGSPLRSSFSGNANVAESFGAFGRMGMRKAPLWELPVRAFALKAPKGFAPRSRSFKGMSPRSVISRPSVSSAFIVLGLTRASRQGSRKDPCQRACAAWHGSCSSRARLHLAQPQPPTRARGEPRGKEVFLPKIRSANPSRAWPAARWISLTEKLELKNSRAAWFLPRNVNSGEAVLALAGLARSSFAGSVSQEYKPTTPAERPRKTLVGSPCVCGHVSPRPMRAANCRRKGTRTRQTLPA